LKAVFKGAATTAIKKEPFKQYYSRLIDNKMRAEMAQLTVARKISAIVLTMWKKGDSFRSPQSKSSSKKPRRRALTELLSQVSAGQTFPEQRSRESIK
jgi:hypothetical protein